MSSRTGSASRPRCRWGNADARRSANGWPARRWRRCGTTRRTGSQARARTVAGETTVTVPASVSGTGTGGAAMPRRPSPLVVVVRRRSSLTSQTARHLAEGGARSASGPTISLRRPERRTASRSGAQLRGKGIHRGITIGTMTGVIALETAAGNETNPKDRAIEVVILDDGSFYPDNRITPAASFIYIVVVPSVSHCNVAPPTYCYCRSAFPWPHLLFRVVWVSTLPHRASRP